MDTDRALATAALAPAIAGLAPERFGFVPRGTGWVRALPGLGEVAFAALGWPHARTIGAADDRGTVVGTDRIDALRLVVRLQAETWGMPPEEVVPVNLLAVLADTGGSVLVAYRLDAGFTPDGWLGFAIAAGGRDGVLVSHMLGVRPEVRGGSDGGPSIGWWLKVLQAGLAVERGHHAASWTFDPMRGANAKLNLKKLGATVRLLTLDKYGPLRSDLYGDVPSDRLTAEWDLLDPAMADRLHAVAAGRRAGPKPDLLATMPEATVAAVGALATAATPTLWYRIPADVDRLVADDPARAARWRTEMRAVLSRLLPTARAEAVADPGLGPVAFGSRVSHGDYEVVGFVGDRDGGGERRNAYVLERTAPPAPNAGKTAPPAPNAGKTAPPPPMLGELGRPVAARQSWANGRRPLRAP